MHMRSILFITTILAIVAAILFFIYLAAHGQKVGAMFVLVGICFLIAPAVNGYQAFKAQG